MRLREREKKDVIVYNPAGFDDDVYLWGESESIRAAIYPNTRFIDARIYGDRIRETKMMLYDGAKSLEVGMGVSLDGRTPAYRIESVEPWFGHQAAVLQWIPEGRRGDGN